MKFLLITLFLGFTALLCGQTLDVRISNIRNVKGQICVALFADDAGFEAERTVWEAKYSKKNIVNGELRIQISVPPGVYGLSVLDDENGSGRMEYNFLGVPREGFGFSDYIQSGLKRPLIRDFDFNINKNELKRITVRMKYF